MDSSCSHDNHNDEARKKVSSDIEQYGCHIIYVLETDYLPGFAYTIGLHENYGAPEIICFGLKNSVLGAVLNDACKLIKNGKQFATGEDYDAFLEGYDVQFLTVNKAFYKDYLGYGLWYKGGDDFPVQQIVWPDKQRHFPWDKGFNPDWKFKQPLLDLNTDFKFYEERDTAVFTTREVLDGSPVLFVYHNEDGDWQFHSEQYPKIEDGKILAFDQITKIDPLLNGLFDLGLGWRAWRDATGGDWQREEYVSEED